MKYLKIFFLLFLFTACNEPKILKNNLIIKSDVRLYDFKNQFYTSYNLFDADSKTEFNLTKKDWEYIQDVFLKYKISKLERKKLEFYKNDTGPGSFYNVLIDTNEGNVNLLLQGIIDDKKNEKFLNEESENLNKFVLFTTSIAHLRTKNSGFTKKESDSLAYLYFKKK